MLFSARFQGHDQGLHHEGGGGRGGAHRGGFIDRGGYHGHRPYGRPYQPRYVEKYISYV